ncbi:MAG: nitroreductase family protein [Chlamydiales bacterium]|nr:nitroreductase family protein [Chlamydiales bacterium]
MRQPEYPIQDLILNRWSPRAMSGENLSDEELMPLLEAARWAPSSYNGQPWRFIPNMIQKLGIWQGGCANFFPGASDHCASTRRK